ncbi:MAG: aldehyde dehydrogenase family protein, partial [Gammaproteobacteria bacterium]
MSWSARFDIARGQNAMTQHFPLLIAAGPSGDGTIEVVAPYDRSPLATMDAASDAAVAQALATAYGLYRNRDAWLSPAKRIEVLEHSAAIMSERKEMLALEAAREGGKPLIDSRVEVARAIDGLKVCIETLRTEAGAV